jgi:NAD-dependent SIR2 family protein deacetylase
MPLKMIPANVMLNQPLTTTTIPPAMKVCVKRVPTANIVEKSKNVESMMKRLVSDTSEFKRILIICGAGISTSAGIEDFRSPQSGLCAISESKYGITDPKQLLSRYQFEENHLPFAQWLADFYGKLRNAKPTLTHRFIYELHRQHRLLRCYTQNLDGLELKCGIASESIVHCHGRLDEFQCSNCSTTNNNINVISGETISEFIVTKRQLPKCLECRHGWISPKIILFGDDLPERYRKNYKMDCVDADLLIVMGTSFEVYPVANMDKHVPIGIPRILVNKYRVGNWSSPFVGIENHPFINHHYWLGQVDDWSTIILREFIDKQESHKPLTISSSSSSSSSTDVPATSTTICGPTMQL